MDEHEMKRRSYKVADVHAARIVSAKGCEDTITDDDVLRCLRCLPFSKNRLRRNVIPDGVKHVYSQCAGLTMSKFKGGAGATKSRIARKCPSFCRLLSIYVRQAEKRAEMAETNGQNEGLSDVSGLTHLCGTFAFTSITINYNYAAKPHRDSSHIGGFARIIALGDFSGGDLEIENCGVLPVKNSWLDFDGRALHSTTPFEGERYSLVYFAHEVALSVQTHEGEIGQSAGDTKIEGDDEDKFIRQDLEALGMRWPAADAEAASCRVSEFIRQQTTDDASVRFSRRLRCTFIAVASAFVLAVTCLGSSE